MAKAVVGGCHPGRRGALPAQQQARGFAKRRMDDGRGGEQHRRAVHRRRQARGKVGVAHRLGRAQVVGAVMRVLEQQLDRHRDLVVDVNPTHPLRAVAEARAQPQSERRQHPRQHAAGAAQHQAGAQQADAHAQVFGAARGLLPGVAQARAEVVAVLLEPLQGEGGVRMPPPGYLREVRRICDRQGWLLLLDEVQTGMCRTGRWFAYQHEEILPDVLALAKGLGNGMPIGACLARGAAAKLFAPGSHGSTFGGNPLAMRVALAVLDVLEEEQLAARAAALGKRLSARLRDGLGDCPGVREIRGMGLMIGIELDRECRDLSARALQEGMLLNVAAGRVVRLLPPLILTDEEADRIADCVIRLLRSFCSPS